MAIACSAVIRLTSCDKRFAWLRDEQKYLYNRNEYLIMINGGHMRFSFFHSQFAHLYATGTVCLECLKICFLGEELAGKTTLAKAIKRTWLQHLFSADEKAADTNTAKERTAGMKIYEAYVSSLGHVLLCDFAGQEYFDRTHALFFDESNSLNIMVVNGLLDKYDMLKQCRRWASFLIAASPSGAIPVVVIVVSRGDICGDARVKAITGVVVKELRAMFDGELNIQERFFILDCRKSQSTGMVEFRRFLGVLKKEKLQVQITVLFRLLLRGIIVCVMYERFVLLDCPEISPSRSARAEKALTSSQKRPVLQNVDQIRPDWPGEETPRNATRFRRHR